MDGAFPARRRWTVRTTSLVVAAAVLPGAVTAGVALALRGVSASSAAVPEAPALDAAHCPVAWPVGGIGTHDRPGPLVPAEGVVSVSLCELPAAVPNGATAPAPRMLTARASQVVAAMNALPSAAHGNEHCTLIAYPDNVSLVVSYADRAPVAVLLDRNCGTATAGGHTRRITGADSEHPALVDAFLAPYREQLAAATSPAGVAAPGCAAALTRADVDVLSKAAEPRDDIARNRGGVDAFAPSALIEVRACRYRTGADGLRRLAAQHVQRQPLTAFRDLLNTAATVRTATDAAGTQHVTNLSECPAGDRTTIDVVWLADATGAVGEVRVPRTPCPELRRAAFPGLVAPPQLLDQLDNWLA